MKFLQHSLPFFFSLFLFLLLPLFHNQAHAAWSVVDSPDYVDTGNGNTTNRVTLRSTSAVSANDVWAVGIINGSTITEAATSEH